MEEGKLHELISKYLAGESSPEEEQDLQRWSGLSEENQQELASYQQLWKMTETPELPFEPNPTQAWGDITAQIDQTADIQQEKPSGGILRRLPLWSKAAAIALLLVASYFLLPQQQGADSKDWVVYTAIETAKTITLPDQTVITLNANSHLRYVKEFVNREIEFEGEAYFDVARDEERPFIIRTGATQTTVLGTAFNLRAYPEEAIVELTMERGQVAFTDAEKPAEPLILQADESGVFVKEEQELRKIDKQSNALSWKNQALRFSDTPISKVVTDLERHFDVEIKLLDPKLGNCQFTGDYKQPKLDQILTVLEIAVEGFQVQRNGQQLVFSGVGCD